MHNKLIAHALLMMAVVGCGPMGSETRTATPPPPSAQANDSSDVLHRYLRLRAEITGIRPILQLCDADLVRLAPPLQAKLVEADTLVISIVADTACPVASVDPAVLSRATVLTIEKMTAWGDSSRIEIRARGAGERMWREEFTLSFGTPSDPPSLFFSRFAYH